MHTGYKEFDSSFEVQSCLDKKRITHTGKPSREYKTNKHIFKDKSILGSDFTHLRVHRVTFNSGAWRERWSNSEDQQKEPVGWLNKFQHTGEKNTEKATFKFHRTASLNHPIYTSSLARQWRGPSVCQRGDAVGNQDSGAKLSIKPYSCTLIKATTQQLKGSIRCAVMSIFPFKKELIQFKCAWHCFEYW